MAIVDLSVIVPAFNEAAVIEATVREVLDVLAGTGLGHEVIVADDGSHDDTRAIAGRLDGVRVLAGEHRGKGAAVRRGMLAASGRWRLFMDADNATRLVEWAKFHPFLAAGCDLVIGSRKMAGAEIATRQSPLRENMGRVFTRLSNRLLGTSVSDFTCGFKAFQAHAATAIFSRQHVDGWGFDAEILFLAQRLGFRVQEVPVVWRHQQGTKVRLGRDAVRSFQEILAIRAAARQGRYDRAAR